MGKHKKTHDELSSKLKYGVRFIEEELGRMEILSPEDPMRLEIAAAIATKLRVFVADSKNNHSLIKQLGIKDSLLFPVEFVNGPDLASNLIFSSRLVGIQVSADNRLYCEPIIPKYSHRLSCTFSVWLDEIIIDSKGNDSILVSRNDVIRILADKEGGAHEDPYYHEDYFEINYNNGFCIFDSNGKKHTLENNYYVESLVVIATEFLDAISTFRSNILGKSKTVEKTRFNAIQITYIESNNGHSISRSRYFLNTNEELCTGLQIAFDYYREAQYALVFLKGQIYRDLKRNTIIKYLVLDKNDSRELIYLRADKNDDIVTQAVLLENGGEYIRIYNDTDIYNKRESHTLDYYIKELGNGETAIFDSYLKRQMITVKNP